MRNLRIPCILAAVTVALIGLSAVPTSAQDLCPYDVSGDYTYHPGETPNYLFFGDGQITYDQSTIWYLDDVLACYNTYQTPGYLIYFPKCDIDGDGSVSIGEVYDIYHRVHPVNQTDYVAQSACVEAFHSQSFFFCHPSRYNRTVIDMQTIANNYPAAEAIGDGSGLGHETAEVSYNQLRCTTPDAFPAGIFETLDACYLANSTCEGPSCSIVNVDFSQAIDVYNVSSEYNSIAQDFGGSCAMVPRSYTGADAPGFHYSKYELDGKFWIWDVRATAQCVGSLCDCDQRYRFYTHTDYPGSVWLMEEFNLSEASCTDPRFPPGTGCADADGDGVCDTDDQCPGVDDNLDTDGDGAPDCLEQCDNDPLKTSPGQCGCGNVDTDTDGDGVADCIDPCPDDNPDDPDGDGVCGEPRPTMIDDFENTTDTWPWAPWVVPNPSPLDGVSDLAAHDGAYGLALFSSAYRTDVSFGAVENEVLSMWCLADDYQGCSLGFGADSTGYFSLRFRVFSGGIEMRDSHGQANPWSGPSAILATSYVEGGIPGNVWYKMEVHVRAGGEIDGQIWAADGVTPVGSVQYNFGPLPATGIAIHAGPMDTIQQAMGDGSCIDIDWDGSCDADDLCQGDDTTGDSDGDGVCDDLDQCIGFDLAGDADGDGYCDDYVCPADMPAFYDQSGSTNEWVAGAVCVDMYRATGPPACNYNEWLSLQDDIALIEATYPCTVGMNTMIINPPDKLICSGLPAGSHMISLFDDLNACWHGNSGWFSGITQGIIAFDWNVNVWDAVNAYHQRAAIYGGFCELDTLFGTPPVGYRLTLDNGWRRWDIYHESDPSCRFVVWLDGTPAPNPAGGP